MKYPDLIKYIKSDLYRYCGRTGVFPFIRTYIRTIGFKYMVRMRICRFCREGKFSRLLFPLAYFLYRRAMIKYGILIPYKTNIGYGFYIGHFGGIVINSETVIGDNCNISQGVTIGVSGKSNAKESPHIGNGVYIGPHAVVAGPIEIGAGACIGANACVVKSVPPNITVGGVPAKKISDNGSEDYVHNTWKMQ